MFKGLFCLSSFSNDDFWDQNPYPETSAGDVYTIGTDSYGYNSENERWESLNDD